MVRWGFSIGLNTCTVPIWYTAKLPKIGVLALAPWHRKEIQCHPKETFLQMPKIGVLALAPQKKYDSIVTRQICNCTKEALPATLVDATGAVRLLLSIWSECRETRISGAHYLRVQLLCCCQRGSKTRSASKLFLSY